MNPDSKHYLGKRSVYRSKLSVRPTLTWERLDSTEISDLNFKLLLMLFTNAEDSLLGFKFLPENK